MRRNEDNLKGYVSGSLTTLYCTIHLQATPVLHPPYATGYTWEPEMNCPFTKITIVIINTDLHQACQTRGTWVHVTCLQYFMQFSRYTLYVAHMSHLINFKFQMHVV